MQHDLSRDLEFAGYDQTRLTKIQIRYHLGVDWRPEIAFTSAALRTKETMRHIAGMNGIDFHATVVETTLLFTHPEAQAAARLDEMFRVLGYATIGAYQSKFGPDAELILELGDLAWRQIRETTLATVAASPNKKPIRNCAVFGHAVILPAVGFAATAKKEFLEVDLGEASGVIVNLLDDRPIIHVSPTEIEPTAVVNDITTAGVGETDGGDGPDNRIEDTQIFKAMDGAGKKS